MIQVHKMATSINYGYAFFYTRHSDFTEYDQLMRMGLKKWCGPVIAHPQSLKKKKRTALKMEVGSHFAQHGSECINLIAGKAIKPIINPSQLLFHESPSRGTNYI